MNSSNAFTQGVEAFDGLRPSFSAHVRWSNMGHPSRAVWSWRLRLCPDEEPLSGQIPTIQSRVLTQILKPIIFPDIYGTLLGNMMGFTGCGKTPRESRRDG
jgi:hypothetical protein